MGETEDQALTIQRRSLKWWDDMKDSILEEPLIHLSIWIRNVDVMNEEDDEAEGSRRSLPTKRREISIQLSWYYFVMHDRMFALMTVYY